MAVFTSAPFSWSLQHRAPQAPAGAGVMFLFPHTTILARFQPVHQMQQRANDGNGFVEDLLVAILARDLVVVIAWLLFVSVWFFDDGKSYGGAGMRILCFLSRGWRLACSFVVASMR